MNSTIIIAEAGVNHNGDINIARELIDAAKEAGVDYVKFQTFKSELLSSPNAKKANYQKVNLRNKGGDDQLQMLKRLELNEEVHYELLEYSQKKKINFLSSPFDISSIRFLEKLGLQIIKIPSGEITNYPYLEEVGKTGREVILSTGMSTLGEIEDALSILVNSGLKREKITVLHCNTEYPTPFQDVNLNAMLTIREAFKIKVGYSDHTLGIEMPIAAVALGAKVIEKHFTLSREMDGPDHKASLEPSELFEMVSAIRNVELAMGDGIKKPSSSEERNMAIARKSLHFSNSFQKGHILTSDDITVMRPGDGLSPKFLNFIIGKKLKHPVDKYQKLKFEDLC